MGRPTELEPATIYQIEYEPYPGVHGCGLTLWEREDFSDIELPGMQLITPDRMPLIALTFSTNEGPYRKICIEADELADSTFVLPSFFRGCQKSSNILRKRESPVAH